MNASKRSFFAVWRTESSVDDQNVMLILLIFISVMCLSFILSHAMLILPNKNQSISNHFFKRRTTFMHLSTLFPRGGWRACPGELETFQILRLNTLPLNHCYVENPPDGHLTHLVLNRMIQFRFLTIPGN